MLAQRLNWNIVLRTSWRSCSSKPNNLPAKSSLPEEIRKSNLNREIDRPKFRLPTKEEMVWRKQWHEKYHNYFSLLRSFYTKKSYAPVLRFISLDYQGYKDFWNEHSLKLDKSLQGYVPERNQLLGNELAAAHFLVHRGGAIKFHEHDQWIKADKNNNYTLPKVFEEGFYIEALDCSSVDLYYEGMVNFRNLRSVEWLSLNGCELLDDWALDRVGNLFSHSLVYLDIRNMPNITYRGIGALNKLEHLKILCVSDNMFYNKEIEMTLLMLQEINPILDCRLEQNELLLDK